MTKPTDVKLWTIVYSCNGEQRTTTHIAAPTLSSAVKQLSDNHYVSISIDDIVTAVSDALYTVSFDTATDCSICGADSNITSIAITGTSVNACTVLANRLADFIGGPAVDEPCTQADTIRALHHAINDMYGLKVISK